MMKTLYTNQSDFTFLRSLKFLLFLFVGLTALPGNIAAAEMEEEMCDHKTLTIFNNGACAVDILLWQAGGDVYYTTLHPCQSWAVNSEEGIKWRAINTDPDWGNLRYDEHYMLNGDCQQDWTITPNYCGGGTCTDQVDVDFAYDCDAGVRVDLYGEGCDGGGATVNIPNPGNVFQAVIEAVYKGCDPGSSIHVNVGGSNVRMDKITIPLGRSTDVYLYRTVLDSGISSATHTGECGECRNNSGLQSMVAYAFRDLGTPSAATGTLTSVSGYNDVRNFTIPLITDANSRNVTVEIPVSEVTDDDRHLQITATAGGQSSSRTINAPNAGCCLNIVEITIPNVPGSASSVNIELDATSSSDNRTPRNAGQSYVIAGIINATSECGLDCNKALTINNNGDCDVELYKWVDEGDVFEANIAPGQSVTVVTGTGLMWRATDAPDPDFNNLLFDASYTSTDECNQVWNIDPDYCDLLCNPNCGDNDLCEAIRAYRINDVDPVCTSLPGTGVLFQRDCGETFTTWQSNGNLFLYEFADGTAKILGTVTNGNTTAQVDICLDDESNTGTTWQADCYTSRLGAVERFYNCFDGTITYNGTAYTIHKKGNGTGFIIAAGAGNEGSGLGMAGWTTGTFGTCGEWFSDLQRIDAPEGEAAASNNGPISCTTPSITITALPNGGTYSWTGPGGFTSDQQSPQVGVAGTYTVTVINSDGCEATAETVVEADDEAPSAAASNNGPICDGDVIEISASSTTANVSYTWVGEGLNANQTTSQNNTITGLTPGSYDYTVTVTNLDNGCTAEATTTVVVFPNPDSGISAQDQVCAGETAQFAAVPTVDGATYAWTFSGPATPSSSDQSVVNVIWDDVPGEYLATLTVEKDGCVSTFTHAITVTMEVRAIAPPDATICQGGSITLDASDSQGNGFLWSVVSGDPTSLDLGGNSNMATVSPLVTTTYEIKVDDSPNGCTKVDAVTIFVDVNFNPIADAGDPATICENGMIMLDGTGSQAPPADPGAALSYIWSPANLLDDPTSATPKATVSENTTFELIVAVPNGCSDTSYVDITVAGCDLSLDKVVSDETPNVGDEVTFTVTVTNEGSLPVSGIAVEDALPGGFSNINSISNGGSQTGSIISWSGLTLAPNASAALTFNATVNAPAGGDTYYCNTAQITASDEFDIDSTPNNDDGDQSEDDEAKAVIVPQQADLSLTKAVSNESPNVGDVVTFTITVTNDGPDAATNVSITDPVPNGFSGISAVSNGGAAAGNDITWSGLTIAANASTALTFNAIIEAPVAGIEFCNIAQVAASDQYDSDSAPANDDGDQSEDDEAKVLIVPQQADLSLVKAVSDESPNVGDVVTFTITVTNDGPNDATNVSVTDPVPNGFSGISAISNSGSAAGSDITWSGLSVAANSSVALTFNATIEAPLAGVEYCNTAQVAGSDQYDLDSAPANDDGDQSEDDESKVLIVPQVADVSLVKEVSDASPNVGDVVTFTITVTNDGPNDATNVSVSDAVPNGYSAISNVGQGGSAAGSTVSWSGLNIANGASTALTFDATIEAPLAGVDYLNIAEVTGMDQFDNDSAPGNDDGDQSEDDEDNAEVVPQVADVSLVKEVSDAAPNVGDVVTFTITVTNDGPNDATNVSVSDAVPNGYSAISNVGQGGSAAGSTVNWSGLNVANGASVALTFDATIEAPLAGVDYLNIAEVTAMDQFDNDSEPGNDDGDQSEDDEDNAEVVPQVADVSLVKEVSNAAPNVGDVVTFTITVTNDGPNDATNVSVSDAVPNGYSAISNVGQGGSAAGSTVSWSGLNVANGASVALTFDATIEAPLAGVDYLNIAEVTAMDQFDVDSTPSNDDGDQSEDDEDNAEVVPQVADVSLVKEVSNATPNVGEIVTFTITVTNDGPNDATNVSVSDAVPNGYSAISNVGQGGSAAGSTVSWSGLSVANGASVALTFDATIEAPLAGVDYLNIAEVTAMDQFDVDSTPGNDDGDQSEDDEDNAIVEPQVVDVSLVKEISNDRPNVGEIVTFTLTVSNAGPSTATFVTVADDLPNGYTNISNISGTGGQTEGLIVWTGLTIPAGESTVLTFDAEVLAPGDGVDYLNTAEVTFTEQYDVDSEPNNDDGDQSEDDEDNADALPQVIDLSLEKTVSNATPNIGEVITFTIEVSNAGPDAASGVAVQDLVPSGYASIASVSNAGSVAGNLVSWSGLNIPANGSIALTFDVTVVATELENYVNVAEVTAADQYDVDSTPGNDDGDQSEDDEDSETVVPNGSISGTVTADTDNNDTGDAPLAGVTIDLKDLAGTVVATTTTDAAGFYEFLGVAPGDYILMEQDPVGFQDVSDEDTTPDPDGADGLVDDMIPVSLAPGEFDDNNDFVEEQLGSISGSVTADTDNDDLGDTPLAGVTIDLKDLAGTVVATTTTDAAGFYEFLGIEPGDYVLMEQDPAGFQDVSDEDTTPDPDGADGIVDDMIPVSLDAGEADDNNDFVEEELGSISGTVTEDTDNDGAGDAPLAGVTIDLKDLAGTVIASTTTDAAGFYEFLGLQPGDYILMEQDPAGFQDVSDEDTTPDPDGADGTVDDMIPVTLASGEADDNNDFVEVKLGSISGFVSEDVDNDDTGDAAIAGVDILLKNAAGFTIAQTTTDANGFYEFLNLVPGGYVVMEMQPAGFFDVSDEDATPDPDGADGIVDNSIPVTLAPGEADDDNNFVEEAEASISGSVLADEDNDDLGDAGIDQVQILLKDPQGNTVASTVTDPAGFYQFSNVAPGTYVIMEMQPAGYASISDEDATPDPDGADGVTDDAIPVVLTGGENDADNNFVEEAFVSVGSAVFVDSNNNGVQDNGEAGIAGVNVELQDANGNTLQSTTTDASGLYFFGDLAPGDYIVAIPTTDATYTTSSNGNGGDDGVDGDDNGIQAAPGGATASVVISLLPNSESVNEPFAGGNQDNADDFNGDMTIDFGFFAPGSIGNFVWFDVDGDGAQGATEPGLQGVTVNLLDAAGTLITTTTSGPNGEYLFSGLAPGDYIVEFITPASYTEVVSNGTDVNDPNNSDYNPTTGRTSIISLSSGDNELDVDAGFNLILDVSLISFTGRYVEDRDLTAVTWTVANEIDVDYYIVERSFEEGEFTSIGRVDAQANTTDELTYDLDDTDVSASGRYLYRLMIMNLDGSTSYSDIISVNIRRSVVAAPTINVYPNPALQDVNVDIIKNENDEVSMVVFDITGKVMAANVNVIDRGSKANVQLSVENLPKATYILRIAVGDQVFTKKLTVIE